MVKKEGIKIYASFANESTKLKNLLQLKNSKFIQETKLFTRLLFLEQLLKGTL